MKTLDLFQLELRAEAKKRARESKKMTNATIYAICSLILLVSFYVRDLSLPPEKESPVLLAILFFVWVTSVYACYAYLPAAPSEKNIKKELDALVSFKLEYYGSYIQDKKISIENAKCRLEEMENELSLLKSLANQPQVI